MKNKGFFWTITGALIIATIYQLSFTMSTKDIESDAVEVAKEKIDSLNTNNIKYLISNGDSLLVGGHQQEDIEAYFANAYLKSVANEKAHFSFSIDLTI